MKLYNAISFIVMWLTFPLLMHAQEKIYLPFIEAINLNWDYQYSAARLLKTYVDEKGKYIIVLPEKGDTTVDPSSFEKTKQKAGELGTKYFMLGMMNRIGETVIITMTMHNTADGTKTWSDKLKLATPDDLEPVIQKLSRVMGTQEKAAQDGDMYAVTEYDSRELKKINANYGCGVAVGAAYAFTHSSDAPLAGPALLIYYDTRNLLLDMKLHGYFSKETDIWLASVGAYYPFKPEHQTFFAGGGLGFSGTSWKSLKEYSSPYSYPSYQYYDKDQGGGLMIMGGGGFIVNRNSNVVLRLNANAFIGLYKVNVDYPAGILFNMEIILQ